jgi:hypothetical protein
MSGDFFTRATWRPSKRRKMQKRIKPWGGCKTAPAAFLEAGKRTQIQPGFANRRVCTAEKRAGGRCGNLALSGLTVCGCHGGYGIWAKQGKLQPTGKSAAIKAGRAAMVEDRVKAAPYELSRLKTYQNADQRDRMRMIQAWQTPSWTSLIRQIKMRDTGACV